ncbi:uncharacterized protein LOC143997523 [Lithobates pipiens]
MHPDSLIAKKLVSKLKRQKMEAKGIDIAIQHRRSHRQSEYPLSQSHLKLLSFPKARKEILKPNLNSDNNGAQLDPETYSVPDTIPHHFIMMHAFARIQNHSECWVCSHMGTGRHSVPMVGRPITLEQLLDITQQLPLANTTTINKPLLFTGYTRKPQFCFLNGAGRDLYNAQFCRDTLVNFTILDLPLALNGTIEVEGLLTHNIPNRDDRISNMSRYNISKCARGYNLSRALEWLQDTHMKNLWMGEEENDTPSLGDWLCLVGLRSKLSSPKIVPAPHVPHGWMVCCGLWCHTTIPYPMDRKTAGWCTLVEMIPFVGTTTGDSPVSMVPAHGHLEFERQKREITTWWGKVFASFGGAGIYNALAKVDEFGMLVDSWMNKTAIDIGLLNEELRKILFEQEIIKQRQERMMMILTELCDVTGDRSLCCTYMNNLTKPSEDLQITDYYEIIKGHNDERAKLQDRMRRLGDSWNPFSGVGGWFGSFWDSIMNFFKKVGMILIIILILGIAIYATIKIIFCLMGKATKIKPSTSDPDTVMAMFYSEHRWY